MPRIHFRKLDLPSLIAGCQNEARRSSSKAHSLEEEGYCFELFRRAIEKCDAAAWDAIHQQYRKLVIFWVGPQQEDAEELVNQAFVKFWRSCSNKSFSRCFSHVGQVLKFLKRCAYSARLDLDRRRQREQLWIASEEAGLGGQSGASVEDMVLDDVVRQQRKAQVEARLRDDQERLVIYLSFELDLSPSEIVKQYPRKFSDVEEVRRVKERVVKRLKEDAALRQWLE